MNEDQKEKFDKNVQWLKRYVDQDDIYKIAEQLLITAEFFMNKWGEWVDIERETEIDPHLSIWVDTIVKIQMFRKMDSRELLREYLDRRGKP